MPSQTFKCWKPHLVSNWTSKDRPIQCGRRIKWIRTDSATTAVAATAVNDQQSIWPSWSQNGRNNERASDGNPKLIDRILLSPPVFLRRSPVPVYQLYNNSESPVYIIVLSVLRLWRWPSIKAVIWWHSTTAEYIHARQHIHSINNSLTPRPRSN